MRAFWGVGTNVGDTLTPVILEHFTHHKAEWVSSLGGNKLLMCGSILEFAKPGDTVLGAGHYKEDQINLEGVKVLALRGQHSGQAPVYGDPALLLPLIYSPRAKKKRAVGYVPHLWDQGFYDEFIDVNLPWKKFVDEILSSEYIISTSLHGKIIADAYGVPSAWVESKIVPGAKIKYEDYLLGIREGIPICQKNLLRALEQL